MPSRGDLLLAWDHTRDSVSTRDGVRRVNSMLKLSVPRVPRRVLKSFLAWTEFGTAKLPILLFSRDSRDTRDREEYQ